MENLIIESRERINSVSTLFVRYLYKRINWKNRLIAIKGSRGVGKTTLLLQYLKEALPHDHTVLYVPLDHLYFYYNKLIDLADQFVLNGGKYLFLDEIHKYFGWSRELKLIYDKHTELQIVFTSSSILEIYKGESESSFRL
jgi:predicted AAA+ superfamily ATPase